MPGLLVRLLVLFLLLAPMMPLRHVPDVAPTWPHSMPPHPHLRDRIARGEVPLPLPMAVPTLAAWLGLDTPQGPPRRLTGSINALAVVVDFDDNVHTVTAQYFDSLVFAAPVPGRGSVRDYYQEVSYGQVDIVTVNFPSSLGWQRAPQNYAYYVNNAYCEGAYPNNCRKLAEDIVDAVNGVVDFSHYDSDGDGVMQPIMLIHAGPGAELTGRTSDVWSHSWTLLNPRYYDGVTIRDYVIMPEYWSAVSPSTSDMTIGVFAHEMGHGFWNLPDLYDRDNSSYGVGDWSLMATGSWNGPNSGGWGSDGSSPAWPDAWSRVQMGFVPFTNIAANVTGQSIPQAYNNPPPAQTVLKLRSNALGAQEYFVVENRQQVAGSYDEYLPGSGLLIWHVDEAMWTYALGNDHECTQDPHCNCSDTQHFLVALEQADAQRHLEFKTNQGDQADPFPGPLGNRNWTRTTHPESSSWYACTDTCIGVTNISNAGATMTADLQVTCGGPPPPPTAWVYLPLVFKFYRTAGPGPTPSPTTVVPTPTPTPTTPPGGWQTIVYEDFEGAFPGVWDVFDNWPGYGEYYWGRRSCRPYAGNYSGWAVGDGADGKLLACGSDYPPYAESWMVYGPFSLADASAADLSFQGWTYSEYGYDGICYYASIDGYYFYGYCVSGDTQGWTNLVLDLSDVPPLGDLRGQPNVWIALVFISDESVTYAEGGYVDHILLRKCVGSCALTAPTPAPLPASWQVQPSSLKRPNR